jgi:hypothetical protein
MLPHEQPFDRAPPKPYWPGAPLVRCVVPETLRSTTTPSPALPSSNPSPQDLKRIQISVLHRVESCQSGGRRVRFETGTLQPASQRGRNRVVRRPIDQKHSIAALVWKTPRELIFGNDQVALQNGICDRAPTIRTLNSRPRSSV